jgi:DNA (cytosine-5)-methyltransferase 1
MASQERPEVTYLSLFSGIGGLDLGLDRAGWTCLGQCEIDPYARAVLARHWPDVPRFADVTRLCANGDIDDGYLPTDEYTARYGFPDAIVGGFPCQDISVAGKGDGLEGSKSGLWYEYLRIVAELRPRWVVAENVPALRTRGIDQVLAGLEELGYTCWPVVVGAEHVGAPHRRHRVFIVANAEGQPRRTGFIDTTTARRPLQSGRAGDAVAHGERPRLEGQRADAGTAEVSEPRDRRAQWPMPPGRIQHDWEKPREVELQMGVAVDGVPGRLVRFANRSALRVAGNAVVPQVAEAIGRAVLQTHRDTQLTKGDRNE